VNASRARTPWWYAALALGFLARVLPAPFVSNTLDLRLYGLVALDGAFHRGLYQDGLFSYPPLWGYAFQAIGRAWMLFSIVPFAHAYAVLPYTIAGLTTSDLTTPLATLALKLPSLACDIAMLALLLTIARESGAPAARSRWIALVWWLNPIVLFGSAINASWDVAVALSVLAALYWARREYWWASGAALALGVLAKLTPLYAIVAIVPMVFDVHGDARLRRLVGFAGGFALTIALGLVPIAARHEWSAMLYAVFTRAGTFRVGGANLWSFVALHPFRGVAAWIELHRGLTVALIYALSLAGAISIATLLLRLPRRQFVDYLLASTALLLVTMLASPFDQPTYTIWILPPMLLLCAFGLRGWGTLAILFSLFAGIYAYTIRSAQDMLMPLCVFAHRCDPATFGHAAVAYRMHAAPLADNLQVAIDAVAGEAIGICAAIALVVALRQLAQAKNAGEDRLPSLAPKPGAWNPMRWTIAGTATLVACAMLPLPASPSLRALRGDGTLVIASAGYAGTVHVVMLPVAPRIGELDVYFDPRYVQGRGITATFSNGFAPHLRDELNKREQSIAVRDVDARALAVILRGDPAEHALLVLGGILPDTARGRADDRLQRWIARGGVVVWAGEAFDLLYARAFGRPSIDYTPWRLWYAGNSLFPARVDTLTPPLASGTVPAPTWPVARLSFARTTFAVNEGPLHARGGTAIGFIDDRVNSSVSVIPYGRGRIVFFGDGFDDEIVAAEAVAQIFATQAWFSPASATVADGWIGPHAPPLTLHPPARTTHAFIFGEYPDDAPFANVDYPRQP
jgi:hypothetical protein